MNSQVERLEQLLFRVQENRAKPRASLAAAPAAKATPAAVPLELDGPGSATPSPGAPTPVPGPALPREPSPLEAAVAGQLNRPAPAPPGPPAPVVPLQAVKPAAASVGRAGEPEVLAPDPPQPSRPIAHIASKHPPLQASTFGEVLRRSLALRPR